MAWICAWPLFVKTPHQFKCFAHDVEDRAILSLVHEQSAGLETSTCQSRTTLLSYVQRYNGWKIIWQEKKITTLQHARDKCSKCDSKMDKATSVVCDRSFRSGCIDARGHQALYIHIDTHWTKRIHSDIFCPNSMQAFPTLCRLSAPFDTERTLSMWSNACLSIC